MRACNIIMCSLAVVALASCSGKKVEKKTPEQIFNESVSGVVTVVHQSYYEADMPTGEKYYFSGCGEDGLIDQTMDSKALSQTPFVEFSAGTLMSDDGQILVDKRIIKGDSLNYDATKQLLLAPMNEQLTLYDSQLESLQAQYENLNDVPNQFNNGNFGALFEHGGVNGLTDEINNIADQYKALEATRNKYAKLVDIKKIKIKRVDNYGVAFNGNLVSSPQDFIGKNPCVVMRQAKGKDVNLALLQLKSKKAPDGAHIFQFMEAPAQKEKSFFAKLFSKDENIADSMKLAINKPLYMISFCNIVLDGNKVTLKAQLLSGILSSQPNGTTLTYTLPANGSLNACPVVDGYGFLVGINFEEHHEDRVSNYGVSEGVLKAFMNESAGGVAPAGQPKK